jgi:hypothetical protein
MNALELLEKHPRAGSVIRNWLLWRMVEALESELIDEEFKQYMRDQGIENDKIAPMIDANPRMLLDVFDENNIYVGTLLDESNGFWWTINGNKSTVGYEYRKNCEIAAIETAFKILEKQLTPKEETNENE